MHPPKIPRERNGGVQVAHMFWSIILPRMPLVVSTTFGHVVTGAPAKTWDLKFHICWTFVRNFLRDSKNLTVEAVQSYTMHPIPGPIHYCTEPFTIPNESRARAATYLGALLKGQEEIIGWNWQDEDRLNACGPLKGEWIYRKVQPEEQLAPKSQSDFARSPSFHSIPRSNSFFSSSSSLFSSSSSLLGKKLDRVIYYLHGGAYYLCSTYTHRRLIAKVAKRSAAKVFAINYRLAPQHPFPAALHDALAGYLYLISPPAGSGEKPIDPKKIVIMGDSAGGGLALSLLLALRDSGLPLPAGAACMSPWVDLTHAFPSIVDNSKTDYIPANGFSHLMSPAQDYSLLPKPVTNSPSDAEEKSASDGAHLPPPLAELNKLRRLHFYAPNTALRLPLVSPVYAKDLGGLPPLLIQLGGGEMVRDEGIFLAHKAASGRGELPPTDVTLQVYEDMPHVFQMFQFLPVSHAAVRQLGEFTRQVTSTAGSLLELPKEKPADVLKRMRVNSLGYLLEEESGPMIDVDTWEQRYLQRDLLHRLREFFLHGRIII
ncbi:uncharacterized protein VTP21DRAFT_7252 [Calcarisporiella thermophila]|uniref:uncharacterized protein n=1 Tax=Calcarisporiella thermophila TaxID=911321 RepID=UPI0037431434